MLDDQAVTNWQLRSLGDHLDALLAHRARRPTDSSWLRRELRAALESAQDLLVDVAVESGLDNPETRTMLAMRDVVAIHIRAADDVERAGGRPETALRLLVRAAVVVNEELALIVVGR